MDVTKVLERTPYNELSYVNELEGKEQDETTNKDLCQRWFSENGLRNGVRDEEPLGWILPVKEPEGITYDTKH